MNSKMTALCASVILAGGVLYGVVPAGATADERPTADKANSLAEECVPSEGTDAHFTDWVDSHTVGPHHDDPTPPVDPDGSIDPSDPANLTRIMAPTETKHVTQEATESTYVFDHWQRYSWTGGPHASDDPPPFPSADWQPNVQGDPHGVGVEGAYFRSHGNSGNGDWFYLEAVEREVPGQREVSHTDYTWVVQVREYVAGTDPVTCDPDDPTTEPDPDRPIRATQCVGNDLVVTVTYPNGNIEHTPHVNDPACASPKDPKNPTVHKGVGTPRRADAPKVTVNEEGM